jgi:hypothetical protein
MLFPDIPTHKSIKKCKEKSSASCMCALVVAGAKGKKEKKTR